MPRNRRIGLLGGSFNPAHAGHLHVSLEALKRLRLDEVWWLVSPQNPLKSPRDMAAYDTRLASAAEVIAGHRRIRVSAIESQQGWRYTIDTVRGLQRLYPGTRFVWLMGADNLAHFHRWRAWAALAGRIPIAVFDRAPFSFAALGSRFALRYGRCRIDERDAALLPYKKAPHWAYIHMKRHPLSSTTLRNSLGEAAFLRHTNPQASR